jgi:superfamily II DNA/RNA helicase
LNFTELNLDAPLLKAIDASGFTAPTEIQQQAIPVVMAGRDLMASAQTGTGKTAAFVLPALQKLLTPSTRKGNGPRVLVLTPTRELATQVNENIVTFGRFGRFVTGNVVGGTPYGPQMKLLRQHVDLLVATPGRLMDHMEQGRVDFSRLEMLVLDEADRMLDMGFIDAVRLIAKHRPSECQTLLFSATLEGRVLHVAQELLKNPERVALAANTQQHASITQRIYRADDIRHKHALLRHHLSHKDVTQAVVFTATKRAADKLARELSEDGHRSAALHGDMAQGARRRTVERMQRGNVRVLVATDVAARGLDIRGISHVINFDLPMVAEDYIHRIGRTGRGGASGTAISLVGPDDRAKLRGIERLTGRRMDHDTIPGLEPKTPDTAQHHKPGGQRPGAGKGRPGGYKGNKNFSPARNGNGKPGGRPGGQRKPAAAGARRSGRSAPAMG